MTTVHDQDTEEQIQRQMGCMAGFLHMLDPQKFLTGKRIYSAKRLAPPPSLADSASGSENSIRSAPASKEPETMTSATPDRFYQSSSPAPEILSKAQPDSWSETPPPVPGFEIKEGARSSCKYREAPRFSLDSRATTDANGTLRPKQIRTINQSEIPGGCGDDMEKQCKSTGVIARLMGLEPLQPISFPETPTLSPQLRRSASESRVARDLFQTNLAEPAAKPQQKSTPRPHSATGVLMEENAMRRPNQEFRAKPAKCETTRFAQRRHQQQRNYFDSADYFPEPKQMAASVYGEIEKRLKMSGLDGSSRDLETLKHVLEALQLKGLLHSTKSIDQTGQRKLVHERNNKPPIVVMKPSRSPFSGTESPPPIYLSRPSLSPRRKANVACEPPHSASLRNGRIRNSVSPTHSELFVKSNNSTAPARKQSIVEIHSSRNASVEQRRVSSPVISPKPSLRRSIGNQASSPRNKRSAMEAHPTEKLLFPVSDNSSLISESSISNISQSDSQRVVQSDEYKEGKSLLSRCDKLLQSIAEMNTTNAPQQPSPVSVLDPSFYKEDESSSSSTSPSPVPKRSIDFKVLPVDFVDEELLWTSSAISTVDGSLSDDSDFNYVAEVLRTLAFLPDEPAVFPLLEKQQYKRGNDASKISRLNRKLIFDNVSEILNKNKQLPPWKSISSPDLSTDAPSLPYIWSELKKLRERDESDQELFQVICGLLKKDLAAASVNEWVERQTEVADSVLDIERLIFKDLISETIRDLASLVYRRR